MLMHAAVPARDERSRQQAHEAGKANEFDAMDVEHVLQRVFESLAIPAEGLVIDHRRGNARCAARGRSPAASGLFDTTSTISAG